MSYDAQLVLEYKESRRSVQEKLKSQDLSEVDRKKCESMLRSLDDTIFYMEKGYFRSYGEILVGGAPEIERIAARRGLSDLTGYEYIFGDEEQSCREENPELVDFMSILSKREAEIVLAYERGMSMSQIAEVTGIKKSTVQCYIERAREKLAGAQSIQLGMFETVQFLNEA